MRQVWDPKSYSRNAAFVPSYGTDLLSMLSPSKGRALLDLGCGDGVLTAKLLILGWSVTGIDSSEEQVRAAIERGVNAIVMDGQKLRFSDSFDCVISNAALHWMRKPEMVLRGVWNALRRGGVFLGEMGGYGNVQTVVQAANEILSSKGFDPGAQNPWYFPKTQDYSLLLKAQGFLIDDIYTFKRPTELPGDILDWLAIFMQSFASPIKKEDRAVFYNEIKERVKGELFTPQGKWVVDYVRLRFKAHRSKE